MPVKCLMSRTKQGHWQKRYVRKLYGVSPRQPGCPPTKEGSRVAANVWWEKKQAAIDAGPKRDAEQWQDFIDVYGN